jgi:hypothetical protein
VDKFEEAMKARRERDALIQISVDVCGNRTYSYADTLEIVPGPKSTEVTDFPEWEEMINKSKTERIRKKDV